MTIKEAEWFPGKKNDHCVIYKDGETGKGLKSLAGA